MNYVYLFTGLTLITVVAFYFSFLRFYDVRFIGEKWYKITELVLWVITGCIWIADFVFLGSYFDSGLAVATQVVIQVIINSVLVFWPISILDLFIKTRPNIDFL